MNRKELIAKYIEFFKSKGHVQIPNGSLVPANDPTVLFTTAGMHPLVPFLSGQPHPQGKRLVNVQKCIRTGDIDEVGDTYHHTFFEMLGNWSLGDYWKKEAIEMTFEFYTKVLSIPVEKLAVTIFAGDEEKGVVPDNESKEIWKNLGVSKIMNLKEDNWWGPAGRTGPCGPSTEVFYWKPKDLPVPEKLEVQDFNDGKWVEIGNDVLMEYVMGEEGGLVASGQKNIDFGGGVERTIASLSGLDDNYMADMWRPMIDKIEELSGKSYIQYKRDMRIIADHLKAAVMIINDGVVPGNSEQGYVLRRLIRRAIRFGKVLGLEGFVQEVAKPMFEIYDDYNLGREKILHELKKEEERFLGQLDQGMKVFEKLARDKDHIPGYKAFLLYQSYGFPLEMTQELAKEKGLEVDLEGYEAALKRHQELSRTATEGRFKSGLADSSEQTTRLHTATHLLLAAMNKTLPKPEGMDEIMQRGSNITAERARFDFSFDRKLTDDEVKQIEGLVNDWMRSGQPVVRHEMSLEEAKEFGAAGIFEDKYSKADIISVYAVGDGTISKEMCTGPHVSSMDEFKDLTFKITKQKSVGSGVRRVRVELLNDQ